MHRRDAIGAGLTQINCAEGIAQDLSNFHSFQGCRSGRSSQSVNDCATGQDFRRVN
jgi:hypothetical protein